MVYVKIKDIASGETWILASSRLCELYKKPKKGKDYTVVETFKGKDLEGKSYVPLFNYFKEVKIKLNFTNFY